MLICPNRLTVETQYFNHLQNRRRFYVPQHVFFMYVHRLLRQRWTDFENYFLYLKGYAPEVVSLPQLRDNGIPRKSRGNTETIYALTMFFVYFLKLLRYLRLMVIILWWWTYGGRWTSMIRSRRIILSLWYVFIDLFKLFTWVDDRN